MSTRQTEMHAIALRAKAVGWKVTNPRGLAGAYKVQMTPCPDTRCNHMMQLHLTSSDRNAMRTVEREMNAHGLAGLERKAEAQREEERLARIEADRAAAERKAKTLTGQQALIAKAAGPYLVQAEDIDIEWFTTPHPAPWMRWANITPEIATKLLKDHNGDNRPLNKTTIKYYRDIILAGLWHLTHQGMAIDTRALVQDGQHRLHAVIAAAELSGEELAVPFAVFVGMPVENFKTIDEGMLRNARQLFSKLNEKNTSTLQTCVRLVHYYQDGDARRVARLKLPNQVVVDAFEADAEEYRTCARMAQRDFMKMWASGGALAAAMYLIRRTNGADNEFVAAFFDGLATGRLPGTRIVLDDDDPREAFRQKMHGLKLKGESRTSMTQLGMMIATWNNCVSNRRIRNLYFNDDTAIPQVLKCIPGEGVRPGVFTTQPAGAPVLAFQGAA